MRWLVALSFALTACGGSSNVPVAEVAPPPADAHAHGDAHGHDHADAAHADAHADAEGAPCPHAANVPDLPSTGVFGEAPSLTETVTVTQLYAEKDKYLGQTVAVTATITDVCKSSGCWAVLAEGPDLVRVRIPEHAFLLPKDCPGKKGLFQGKVVEAQASPEQLEHWKQESQAQAVTVPELREGGALAIELTGARIDG